MPAAGHRRSRPHPLEPEAANLFFQPVSSRYERASPAVISNNQFSRYREVFGDDVAAAAMIDRLCSTPKSSHSQATATDSKTANSAAPPQPNRLTKTMTNHRGSAHLEQKLEEAGEPPRGMGRGMNRGRQLPAVAREAAQTSAKPAADRAA